MNAIICRIYGFTRGTRVGAVVVIMGIFMVHLPRD
jgi:hypothetical protein